MLVFSGAEQTLFFSCSVQRPVVSFLSRLWSNTGNANQNELLGRPEISFSNSIPNSPNGSQAVFRAHLNTLCHCTIYQVGDTGCDHSRPERGRESGPSVDASSPPSKVLTASEWPCDLDPQCVLSSSLLTDLSFCGTQ